MSDDNSKLVIKKQDGTIVASMQDVQIGDTVYLFEPGDIKGVKFTLHEKKKT